VLARSAVYTLLYASPESDAAAAASGLALRVLLPRAPAEQIALAARSRRTVRKRCALCWCRGRRSDRRRVTP